jgi:hypothetical protein
MDVSGQLHAPVALLPRKVSRHPLDRRLGGPQGMSGCGGIEKKSLPLPGIEPPFSSPKPTARPATINVDRAVKLILRCMYFTLASNEKKATFNFL